MPSFWNIRVLYGPVPALVWPIDLALSIACLKPSMVLMSGRGAPAFTATPLPARANSTAGPITLPSLMSWSNPVMKLTTRSPGASVLIFWSCCGTEINHDFVASRFFVAGRELAHTGDCSLIDHNGDFGDRCLHGGPCGPRGNEYNDGDKCMFHNVMRCLSDSIVNLLRNRMVSILNGVRRL